MAKVIEKGGDATRYVIPLGSFAVFLHAQLIWLT